MIKRFLTIFLPLSFILALLIGLIYYSETKSARVSFETREKAQVFHQSRNLTAKLENIASDLMVLSEDHELKKFLDEFLNFAPEDFINDYLSFSGRKKLFSQIRLIDDNGYELIRINRNGGKPVRVEPSELQYKGNRYYFKEGMELNSGEVFLSRLDLNIENGEIEKPYKPIIRFATPIFDSRGEKRGIIILNVLGKELTNNFKTAVATEKRELALLNAGGYWLSAPDTEDEFGFMIEERKEKAFKNSFPSAWKQISRSESGQFHDANGLFTFTTFYPNMEIHKSFAKGEEALPAHPHLKVKEYYWKIVSRVPQDTLHQGSPSLVGKIIPFYAVIVLILGIVSWTLAKNINERRKAEQKLRNLNSAIEQADDLVVITDPNGIIEYANPAAERVTGYSVEELIGKNPSILKSGRMPDEFYSQMWKTIKAGNIWHGNMINRKKSGEIYHEEMTISPVLDKTGKVTHYVSIKHDVTEKLKAQEELRNAKNRAEEATELKDKFVSLVAHDLRSPFTSILGLLKLMDTDKESPLREKHKEITGKVIKSGEGMVSMIDRLLDITRLQTGKITPKAKFFNACLLVSNMTSNLEYLAQEKGIQMSNNIPKEARLYADPDLFGEVILNLVSNAIKFCEKGDSIEIFVPEHGGATIAVKDTGVGISGDFLQNLFKHEEKTTSMGTAGEKGTGLGLPFSSDIMIAHGGKLTVESSVGRGSVFYAQLP